MKTINVTFEDKEFEDLLQIKGIDTSWREFILTLVTPKRTTVKSRVKIVEGVKQARERIRKEKNKEVKQ